MAVDTNVRLMLMLGSLQLQVTGFTRCKCVQIPNMFVLFLSKALVCSQSQVKDVEEENSKLQLQVKELNEEYRARLVCYLQDLAVSCSTHTGMSTK